MVVLHELRKLIVQPNEEPDFSEMAEIIEVGVAFCPREILEQ
jgi:hypothetical protein